NLVFSLYLDWFSPEGCSNLGKKATIGAIILEPKLEQINHVLQPLVVELKELWDLPALRKTNGFESHAAQLFCSFCLLTKNNLHKTDTRKFPRRTDKDHRQNASAWLQLQNFTKRKKFAKEKGARWSVLNNLPYWRPVQFSSIEMMHALVLGDLKDHSMWFLNVPAAGAQLKSIEELDKAWCEPESL
ncbi:hypothetical protein PTTG_30250, partial [Puccinia triticina 1-1 BBBD Race 1]